MLRVYTDFNEETAGGLCWLLLHRGSDLTTDLVKPGDRVVLFQDEDDFEVEAVIDILFVDMLEREALVAIPDWDTLVRLTP